MVKSFLERAYFSSVLIPDQGKKMTNTDFQYFLQFGMEEDIM